MVPLQAREFIPVELVFNPNWWRQSAGISFDRTFFLDPQTRIDNDVRMRRVLFERFGQMGLGEAEPQPRPIIGSAHVAGGFVIPALLGAEVWFEPDAAPQPLAMRWTPEQIERFEKPDFRLTWPMNDLIAQMDQLEAEWGYVVGDLNTDGALNAAYHLYGQSVYTDFYEAPERVRRLLGQISELIGDVAGYIHGRTGTYSVSVNRMAEHFAPSPFLHANCSVQMISPAVYDRLLLPQERRMARELAPYGIHHCGSNLHLFAKAYSGLDLKFADVGWGSDVARCRRHLPDTFLNLRLSPVRMLQSTAAEIRADAATLARAAGVNFGLCAINMDHGTPDENVLAMIEVARTFPGPPA